MKVGVLLFFIVVGLPFVNIGHFQPFLTEGIDGTLSAAFLIFFAYAGFGKITAASEEMKNARKNVSRAIVAALVDGFSEKVMNTAIERSKTAGEICHEQHISQSTCY